LAHKIKAKLTFPQQQENKTKHYQITQNTIDQLKEERKKENAINEQLKTLETHLRSIRETINYVKTHPNGQISRRQLHGYNIFYPCNEALEPLRTDEQHILRDIEALRTQLKVAVERQMEIEKALRNYPTFKERLEKYEKTGKWKW
jgi:hypothetical protein